MSRKKIRIIKKNDEFSMEYQVGDLNLRQTAFGRQWNG